MRKFYRFLSLAVFLLGVTAGNHLYAQERTVSGKVISGEDNTGLPGVTVRVAGSDRGVNTDVEGNYKISVTDDATLVFSFVGFTTEEIRVGNQTTINVTLMPDILSLKDVVVVGYGVQDKKEITSSVVSLAPEDFNKGNVPDPAQLLQGKVAGLSITRPGGDPNQGFNIRLRGISTFGANSAPLIVLDGVIGASLENVDPNDIESIDVLKDGSAAAIYGARGSSGVILITTTKSKGKGARTQVNVNSFGTADIVANTIPILSPEEFVAQGGVDFGNRTDWRDELTRTGLSGTTNVSVNGGFGNTNYLAAVNYRNNNGIANGVGNERLNTRLNLTQNALNDRLRLNLNLSFTNVENQSINMGAFRYATIYNPTAPIFERDFAGPTGETAAEREARLLNADRNFGGYFQRGLFDFFNPVALANQQIFRNETKTALLSYRAEFDITDKWTVAGQYSQDRRNTLSGNYWSRQDFQLGFGASGSAERNTFDRSQQILELTTTYRTKLAEGLNMDLLGGVGFQQTKNQGFNARVRQFLFDEQTFNNLGAGAIRLGPNTNVSSFANQDQLNSLFGRANFNYQNTYFLSASVRTETYSGFGRGNQTGIFPAISAGTDLTQIFDLGPVNQLKLRASYGITGNLPPSPTLALGVYGNGNRIDLDGDPLTTNDIFVSINQFSNPNPELKWETKKEFNVGVDYALFDGKITGAMDYYTRNIEDLLFNVPVPIGAPNPFAPGNFNTAPTTWVNLADLRAAGFEFVASYNGIRLGDLKYTPSINFTIYDRTRIQSLSIGDLGFEELRFATPGSPGQNNNPIIINQVGERLGNFFGPRFLGVTEDNQYRLSTTNPDNFEVLGNGLPTGDYGFNSTLNYKRWDANIFFRGSWGHQIYNSYRGFYENRDGASNTWNSVRTSKTPDIVSTPTFSDLYLEDGTFLRLDNASIGYSIPTKSQYLQNFRAYFAVQNLWTLTGFTGIDPEVRYTDSENGDAFTTALSPGIERRNTYFTTTSFTLGINITFK